LKYRNQPDSESIYIADLVGLKFNDYKKYSFNQFNKLVIEKIFNNECLDIKSEYIRTDVKFSLREYNCLNADSLYKKYFPTGEYGSLEDETPPPRDVLIALVKLFDSNYLVRESELGYKYHVSKAPTNDEVKKAMLRDNR
jgi:hypothetical protein